jgi:hypothetical protein
MGIAPLISGRRYSFASLEIAAKIGATSQELFLDVDDISYSESLVFEFKNGTSRQPIGNTSGVWQAQEGSLQMGKSTFAQLVTKVGPGWLGINMVMLVSYFDIGEPLTVDTIIARITGVEDAHSYGPGALVSNVKFMPISPIIRNGVPSMLNRVF